MSDFPSGSSINFYRDHLYIAGDDANHLLILNKEYRMVNSVHLIDHPSGRIPKKVKPDFETSTIVTHNGEDHLLLFGSASRKRRAIVVLICLGGENRHVVEGTYYWKEGAIEHLGSLGIMEINIEGSATVGSRLLLSSRAHVDQPTNHLMVASVGFWNEQQPAFSLLPLRLSTMGNILGVSELCYDRLNDTLLLTLSSEDTKNAYHDGKIGDSYIGWITNITDKLTGSELELNGWVNLTTVSDEFRQEKIEGICIESGDESKRIVHLVSDNDLGESRLFQLEMSIQ